MIAKTAHGSGIAAAISDARTARAVEALLSVTCAARGGGGVSGPCHPARAGMNCVGVGGEASKRFRSGRMGVARAGKAAVASSRTASAAVESFRGLRTNTRD